MDRKERWSHHGANLLVGGTGLAYAWFRYGAASDDPYSVVNHPLEPHAQHLHVLLAPLLIFIVGFSWRRHVAPRLRRRDLQGYLTGFNLALSLIPMVFSGYLIQIAVEPGWRKAWVVVHLCTSALWILGYLGHQWGAKDSRPGSGDTRDRKDDHSRPGRL